MVLKDHIDHLEFCLWKSMRKQVVSKRNFLIFWGSVFQKEKALRALTSSLSLHLARKQGQETSWVLKKDGKSKGKKNIPLAVWWYKRECRAAQICRINTNFPVLQWHQHMALTGLIGKVQHIHASILLRNSAADLASQTWLCRVSTD